MNYNFYMKIPQRGFLETKWRGDVMDDSSHTEEIFSEISKKWLEQKTAEKRSHERIRRVCKFLGEDFTDVKIFLQSRGYDVCDPFAMTQSVSVFLYDFSTNFMRENCRVANENSYDNRTDGSEMQASWFNEKMLLPVSIEFPCLLWKNAPEIISFQDTDEFILFHCDARRRPHVQKIIDHLNEAYKI